MVTRTLCALPLNRAVIWRYYKCRSKVLAKVVWSRQIDIAGQISLHPVHSSRSVSRSFLSSVFKLESLQPTAAAAKFHSYHAYIAVQQFLAVPRQRWGDGDTLTTHSQSTETVVNRKQWANSSAAGYLTSLAPRKTSPSSQRGQRHVPGCGNTLCTGHERIEVQQWIWNKLRSTDWGWQYRDESLVPLTTDRPVAPTRVLRILSCGCKTCCRKTCGCPKAGLHCSPMCSYCNGHICSNIHALAVSQDSLIVVWMRQQLSRKCVEHCQGFTSFVLLVLLFVSVSISYAYAHWIRSPIQTLIHHIRTYMPKKHETIHSAIISHGILTW